MTVDIILPIKVEFLTSVQNVCVNEYNETQKGFGEKKNLFKTYVYLTSQDEADAFIKGC